MHVLRAHAQFLRKPNLNRTQKLKMACASRCAETKCLIKKVGTVHAYPENKLYPKTYAVLRQSNNGVVLSLLNHF